MELNPSQVESIVRRVLGEMSGKGGTSAAAGIPKTAKVAMLTANKKIEVREYPIPALHCGEGGLCLCEHCRRADRRYEGGRRIHAL